MKKPIQPWAIGVTVLVVLFPIAFILLAVYASRSDKNLVTDDYYQKDLHYQERIETLRRTQSLHVMPLISYDNGTEVCTIQFPDSARWSSVTGSVVFFRNSDHQRDVTYPLQLDSRHAQSFSMQSFQRGLWRVQLSWELGGLDYYLEERLFLLGD